jgi:Zn-dependent protease with chaperone function
MEMATMVRAFADAAGPLVISTLWQGAALALALALCLRLTPRIAAADRFRVWGAGFAALVALPFLPKLFSFFHSFLSTDSVAPAASLPASAAAAPHAWLSLDPRWSLAIAAVWLAASLMRAIDLGVHALRLRRLWKRAVPLGEDSSGAKAQFNFLAGDAGTKVPAYQVPEDPAYQGPAYQGPEVPAYPVPAYQVPAYPAPAYPVPGYQAPEICTTRDLDRPSVIGFFAPRILIPEWLLERLTAAELEQVILHEAEHLRRRDDWINLLQKLCLVLFPLNPALAWMERRLCSEREMACDEGVVRRTQAPRAYALCLASLAERGLEHRAEALSLGAWQRRPELVDRVHRILRRGPGLHPAAARALLGVMGCGLVFGSVELARCPQVVAFAARPAAPNVAAMNADSMVDGRPVRGFHAINAMAQVHTRAELAQARLAQRRSSATKERVKWSPTLATVKTREDGARSVLAKADVSRRPAAGDALADAAVPAAAEPQQWIVYTAWEQVESTSSVSTPASGPAPEQASDAPRVARRYTVTQLILRVYPAGAMQTGATKGDATKASATRPTASKTGMGTVSSTVPMVPLPAAIPIRGGWLVIQL